MKWISRVAFVLFVGTLIIFDSGEISGLFSKSIEIFGKELAKIEAKKKKVVISG